MNGSMVGCLTNTLLTWMGRFHRGGRKNIEGYFRIEHPFKKCRRDS